MIIPEEYHCKSKLCEIYNHWLNPIGNFTEPLPYPEKRKLEADNSILPNIVWWNLRNLFHNFNHYWIGITPLGKRYEWILPESNGWIRITNDVIGNWQYSYWSRGKIKLPFWNYTNGNREFYIGWLRRGNFGIAFRKI